jgi:Ca2+-binding RTX toxin-like protein
MGQFHMVASRARQPRPALPDPDERNQPRDRTRRRPADQPQGAPGRQPRVNLDGLAIGTPLTAALIGVLLTEGSGALGKAGAAGEAGAAAAVRGGDEAGGAIAQSMVTARPGATGEGGTIAGGASSTSGEIFDPIFGAQAAALGSAPSNGLAGSLDPAAATAAALGAKAPLIGAVNITMGAGAPLGDVDLLDSASDADESGSNGRIGSTIHGTDGDDVIHGTPFNDRLFGGAGDDTIYGHEGDDLLDGGTGNDRLFGGPGDDDLLGGSGNDRLHGGTGDDRLDGGTGTDRLFGDEGRDWLDGGAGDDILDGGADPDRLIGGSGDDTLSVDNIHDVAFGDGAGIALQGNDTLVVQAAFDSHLLQQLGEDRAAFVFSENFGQSLPSGIAGHTQQVAGDVQNVTLEGTADHDVVGDSGDNRLIGNAGDNRLHGGDGDDLLIGNGGADRLSGGAGRDRLEGGDADDVLKGGGADDELHGGAGDDILDGGAGSDLLYGGAGDDNFVIGLNDGAIDTVFDHQGQNWLSIEEGAGHQVQTAVLGGKLYVIVDNAPVAIVDDYVGNEDAFAGIDAGTGLRTIDELMAPGAADGPPLAEESNDAAPGATSEADLLGGHLSGPSLRGTTGTDHLIGTSGSDWLQGDAGADHLVGGAGNDLLEGGAGADLLEGGAGDDNYLLRPEGAGWDVIRDSEGANLVELQGFDGLRLNGRVLGEDLVVMADSAPIFTFESFVGNEQAFAGIQVGDEILTPEDLLT